MVFIGNRTRIFLSLRFYLIGYISSVLSKEIDPSRLVHSSPFIHFSLSCVQFIFLDTIKKLLSSSSSSSFLLNRILNYTTCNLCVQDILTSPLFFLSLSQLLSVSGSLLQLIFPILLYFHISNASDVLS